jgi:hypothetical protein
MQIQGTKPERIGTYSIASIRTATDITAAAPSIMAVGTTTEYNNLDYGLVTKSLTYNGGVKAGMFAVVMQMGTLNASGGYESGNQRVDLVPIEGSTLGMPVPSSGNTYNNFTANFINSYKKAAPPQPTRNPTGGILLCVQEDGGGRTALITIGGSGHDLAVKLEVAPC